MRHLKNILRQPVAHAPLFLLAMLLTAMYLLAAALGEACDAALRSAEDKYSVSVTVSAKPKLTREKKSDKSIYEIVDINSCKVDSRIAEIVDAGSEFTEKSYISGSFVIGTDLLGNAGEISELRRRIASGESGTVDSIGVYTASGTLLRSASAVAASDESCIAEALGIDPDGLVVSYRDGRTYRDGVVIGEALYKALGCPADLALGWYAERSVAPNIIKSEGEGYVFADVFWQNVYGTLLKLPREPMVTVPVAGYYRTEENEDRGIVGVIEYWETLYRATDYYQVTNNLQHYYRDDVSGADEIGYIRYSAKLRSPGEAEDAIRALIADGIDPDSYLISANDHDYKFAVAQVRSIRDLAVAVYLASIVFGIVAIALCMLLAIKRRTGEMYTLCTLGAWPTGVALSVSLEVAAVLFVGALAGCLLGEVAGGSLFAAVGNSMDKAAVGTIEKLSEFSVHMSNGGEAVAQLQTAIENYKKASLSFDYVREPKYYLHVLAACGALTLLGIMAAAAAMPQKLTQKLK